MTQPDEFIFDIAKGDRGVSRHMRDSLFAIRSATADPGIRNQIDDVLAGKASMRSFGASEAFAQIIDGVPRTLMDQTLHMPEEERQRLAERGERELDRLREPDASSSASGHADMPNTPGIPPSARRPTDSMPVPNSRKPNREQIFIPDEPDEDDLYYQNRRNNGWLQ